MKEPITDARCPSNHSGDGVHAVTIAASSLLDFVVVNGQELRVGGVVYTYGKPIHIKAPPGRYFAMGSPAALVSLQCWEPGEHPTPTRRAAWRYCVRGKVASYNGGAQPTNPGNANTGLIVPAYGRTRIDVRVSGDGPLNVVYVPIRYGFQGRAMCLGEALTVVVPAASPSAFDGCTDQLDPVAHIDTSTGELGEVDEWWFTFRREDAGTDVSFWVNASAAGDAEGAA